MSTISVYQKDLNHALRSEGFTTRKIEQFMRVFNITETSQGDVLSLDSTRALLVNVNGTEQGLCLEDFITAWWAIWIVVYNTASDRDIANQALGAVRALFFVSACNKSTSQTTQMQMWWRDMADEHGYPTVEAC